jgi:tetratricopeptide (TPR) repeat protein
MKKSLVTTLLVLAAAALVQQSAAQGAVQPAQAGQPAQAAPLAQAGQPAQPAPKKEIKDPAEYNAYVNAIQQTSPQAKAQGLEAFLQTYSNSVMKEDALEQLMVAYQQANDAQKTIDTAGRVLQANPNNIRALALLAYNYRATASQGGPQMQQNLQQAQQYGQRGLQALSNMPKPDGMSDADFTKLHNETGAIFDGAVGFAALQQKDYATAQKDLREAVAEESQPSIMDIFPLATADLEAKPMNPEGFWFIVKASQLAQGTGQAQILDYGRKKYARFHGSEDGWNDLVKQAQASQSVMPPAGFTVAAAPPPPSPAEQAADLVKSKTPTQMSFAEWELVLSSGNQQAAATVWNALKDKAVKLGANVINASASKVTLAGSQDDFDEKKADITLTMAKPLAAKLVPEAGSLMQFQGTVSSYTPNPFMITMADGVLLDKSGNPVTTAAPVHHPAPRKKSQ